MVIDSGAAPPPALASVSAPALGAYAQLLRTLLDAIGEAVIVIDDEGGVILHNRSFERLAALPLGSRMGVHDLRRVLTMLGATVEHRMLGELLEARARSSITIELRDGRSLLCELVPVSVERPGDYRLISLRDVTIDEREMSELRHRALHDRLTGLPNRDLLLDRLERALARRRREGTAVGVIFIDLDGFKTINDRLGHMTGDCVLAEAAARLQREMRNADTVGRLGGDEFLVVCDSLQDVRALELICERIQQCFSRPFSVGGQLFPLSASLGAVLERDGSADPGEIVARADGLMYTAKRSSSRAAIAAEPPAGSNDRLHQAGRWLGEALERGELWLAYLPLVSLDAERIVGAEALLRCRHPQLAAYTPLELVALAEESGQLERFDRWILGEAARAARELRDAAYRPIRVIVNLSRAQLEDGLLASETARVAALEGIEAGSLGFDVAEGIIVTSSKRSDQELSSLISLGCPLFADDVTGPAVAAEALAERGFAGVKLERLTVQRAATDGDAAAALSALATRARQLGLSAIGEGVSDEDGLRLVRELGCDSAQGYGFYGFPRRLADLARLMG